MLSILTEMGRLTSTSTSAGCQHAVGVHSWKGKNVGNILLFAKYGIISMSISLLSFVCRLKRIYITYWVIVTVVGIFRSYFH